MNPTTSSDANWGFNNATEKPVSPVDDAKSRLEARLHDLGVAVGTMEQRLGSVLRSQPPQDSSAKAGVNEVPQSDLHSELLSAAATVEAKVSHLQNLLSRLTL